MSWPEINANEIMVKRGGSVNPAKFPKEVFDLLSIPAFDRGEVDTVSGSDIGSSKSCVQENDVLLSKIIPHIRRCWVVPKQNGRRQIGSGEWIIFRSNKHDPNYLKHYLTSTDIIANLKKNKIDELISAKKTLVIINDHHRSTPSHKILRILPKIASAPKPTL